MPISKDYNYKIGKYEGICLYCGSPITGKLNKKFCDTKCRVRYRNEINSFKKKFDFKSDSEAHNYFLLSKELYSRDVPVSTLRTDLMQIGLNGFDFNLSYERYKLKSQQGLWFMSGNLFFKIYPEKMRVWIKHHSMLKLEEIELVDTISIKDAFPELNLKVKFTGPF